MAVFKFISDWFSREASHYVYTMIPADRTDVPIQATEVESGKHYFRLWLAEMFLRHDQKLFRTWSPVVHSVVRLQFGIDNKISSVEIPHVAGQFQIEGMKEGNLDRVVQLNHALTALLPFNGGVVDLVSGMVALKGRDLVDQFVNVLGSFSSLLAQPQLSAALEVAAPLAGGVQDLLGGTDGQLKLGLHQAFTGKGGAGANVLRGGYFVVALATEDELQPQRLYVKADQLCRGDDLASARPLTGIDYMLYKVEVRDEKDEFEALTSITGPFHDALRSLQQFEEETAQTYLRGAILAAWQSPDLTQLDRRRVVRELKSRFDQFKADLELGAAGGGLLTLGDVMGTAQPPATAAAEIDLDASLEDMLR